MLRALSIWYLSCCGILCNAIHLGQQIGNLLLQLIYRICSVVWTCVLVICCLFLVASCQRCTHNRSVNGLPPLLKQLMGQHETCSHPTSVDLILSLSVCCASKNQSNAAGNAIEIVCTNHAGRHQLHHANRELQHSIAQHSTAQHSTAQRSAAQRSAGRLHELNKLNRLSLLTCPAMMSPDGTSRAARFSRERLL